ncbi:MAG: hypothetical protein NW200_06000 [Hyphomonadaceae bacterium]|nr:hypothetical protein [Hyphomonadaceae bacterium]
MSKTPPDRPPGNPAPRTTAPRARTTRPARSADERAADAHGDFYFEELMTPQPDATREFYRARLLRPADPEAKDKP